jgi:hypothetical protein
MRRSRRCDGSRSGIWRRAFWSCVVLLAWLIAPGSAISSYRAMLDGSSSLPEGWTLNQYVHLDEDQAARFQKAFGGRIAALSSSYLEYRGTKVQINLIEGKSTADADRIYAALLEMKGGNPTYALRDGRVAIEVITADYGIALRVPYDFGLRTKTTRYRVRFDAAPLAAADYMLWNDLYVAFLNRSRAEDTTSLDAQIHELSSSFRFGESIWLRSHGLGAAPSRYTLSPPPVRAEESGGSTHYELGELPERVGVPCVHVEAEVVCEAFAATPTDRLPDASILGPTPRWPSDDPEIVALAQGIARDAVTVEEKAEAVLGWLLPGQNIEYRGKTGSRYGVKKTLAQGHGHCWDFSDLFVTLCRAVDVPARQVLGWWYGREGHVWAEFLSPGEGWVQVDATGATRCHAEMIPLASTETGEAPFVYVSEVVVEPLDAP